MSSKFTTTVDPTITPEPNVENDETETEEEDKSQSAELPKNSKNTKKSKDEKEEEEETENEGENDEEEEEDTKRKANVKKNKPKHLFFEPLDRPVVLVKYQELLEKFHLRNWHPEWTEWKQVEEHTNKNDRFSPTIRTEIIEMIKLLKQTDKYNNYLDLKR